MKHIAINSTQANILGSLEAELNEAKNRFNIALSMALAGESIANVHVVRVLYGESPAILIKPTAEEQPNDATPIPDSGGPVPDGESGQ